MDSAKQLWKDLFVQHRISSKMAEIAAKEEGEVFHMEEYGQIRVFTKKASSVGDNYMSDAYSMQIKLENGETRSSFVKVLPSNPMLREAAYMYGVYQREIGAYRDMLPALRDFQKEHGISTEEYTISAPESYYVHLEEIVKGGPDGSGTAVVIEDLKCRGFKMADKKVGCDYDHARLTLEALATYHATSTAFIRHHKLAEDPSNLPPGLKFLTEEIFFAGGDQMIQMVTGLSMLSVNILRLSDLNEEADWVEKTLLPNVEEIMKAYMEKFSECDSIPSFIHGDTWINNIMFDYEEERVKSACLVDWQIARVGHPGADIVYFLFSSTTHEMREKHLEQLLQDYYRQFNKVLSSFDIHLEEEGFSFEKFRQEVEKRYTWGLFMSFMILPMILDKTAANKLKEYENDETTEKRDLSEINKEQLMQENMEKFSTLYTPESFLQNKLVCDRVIGIVTEVKRTVGNK